MRLKNCSSGSRDSDGNLVFPLIGWKQGVLWGKVKGSNYMSWTKGKKSFSTGVKLNYFGFSINQILTLFSERLQPSFLLPSLAITWNNRCFAQSKSFGPVQTEQTRAVLCKGHSCSVLKWLQSYQFFTTNYTVSTYKPAS